MEVNPTICKLIIAGAVELDDKEPVFTKKFTNHVSHVLSADPAKAETMDGWCSIITTFDKSLKAANIWDLGIIMSLMAYRMSFINNNKEDASENNVEAEKEVKSDLEVKYDSQAFRLFSEGHHHRTNISKTENSDTYSTFGSVRENNFTADKKSAKGSTQTPTTNQSSSSPIKKIGSSLGGKLRKAFG